MTFPPPHSYPKYEVWSKVNPFNIFVHIVFQMIMGGNHKYSIFPDEYIFAAIAIYLDIINIFLYILRIVGAAKKWGWSRLSFSNLPFLFLSLPYLISLLSATNIYFERSYRYILYAFQCRFKKTKTLCKHVCLRFCCQCIVTITIQTCNNNKKHNENMF